MEFNPANPIIKLLLQGMALEDQAKPDEAVKHFLQAWEESANDFEKFLTAHYVARHQEEVASKLKWLKTGLEYALKTESQIASSALPDLYLNIAKCYEELNEPDKAKENFDLARSLMDKPTDTGPFYHGTKADLKIGDHLTAGGNSNYKTALKMNHIYFTALSNGAGLAAALAKGEGSERIYIVEPTAGFENDPNVTNKKFPGNPTRSYRSTAPLKIVGEVKEWKRLTPEELQKWREKLAVKEGEIIN